MASLVQRQPCRGDDARLWLVRVALLQDEERVDGVLGAGVGFGAVAEGPAELRAERRGVLDADEYFGVCARGEDLDEALDRGEVVECRFAQVVAERVVRRRSVWSDVRDMGDETAADVEGVFVVKQAVYGASI